MATKAQYNAEVKLILKARKLKKLASAFQNRQKSIITEILFIFICIKI